MAIRAVNEPWTICEIGIQQYFNFAHLDYQFIYLIISLQKNLDAKQIIILFSYTMFSLTFFADTLTIFYNF